MPLLRFNRYKAGAAPSPESPRYLTMTVKLYSLTYQFHNIQDINKKYAPLELFPAFMGAYYLYNLRNFEFTVPPRIIYCSAQSHQALR